MNVLKLLRGILLLMATTVVFAAKAPSTRPASLCPPSADKPKSTLTTHAEAEKDREMQLRQRLEDNRLKERFFDGLPLDPNLIEPRQPLEELPDIPRFHEARPASV